MHTLYEQLKKIRKLHKCAFHMPGSKGGRGVPAKYRRGIWKLDYTELEETDNLYAPYGIIKDAEDRASKIYGSTKCFYLVNGSSCGVLASIGYISNFGKKIIVDRNCHISVLNALKLFGITPVFAMPEYLPEFGITGKISTYYLEELIKSNPDIAAVLLTSPNYYGITHDIKTISKLCRKHGKILCVDAAHGAHFAFSDKLPECAVSAGADIVVMSTHKTLPAPTQSAVMHVSDRIDADLIKKQINILQTTSPSYILMAYTDVAISYMNSNGNTVCDSLYENIERFKAKCKLTVLENDDFSRLVINTCSTGRSGFELANYLKDHGIIVEAADLYNIICITGKGNSKKDFARLAKYCNRFSKNVSGFKKPVSEIVFSKGTFNTDIDLPVEEFSVSDCENKICGQTITVYPPGVPVVFEGERLEKRQIEFINHILNLGGTAIGVNNGKIKCFTE